MTRTIEVCIHKEGNSFGFVVRGMYECEQTTSKNSPFLVQFFDPFDFRRLPWGLAQVSPPGGHIREARRSRWQVRQGTHHFFPPLWGFQDNSAPKSSKLIWLVTQSLSLWPQTSISLGDQWQWKEEETLQGSMKRVWGVVIQKSYMRKKNLVRRREHGWTSLWKKCLQRKCLIFFC